MQRIVRILQNFCKKGDWMLLFFACWPQASGV